MDCHGEGKIDHEPIEMNLHILYEDDDLLIVDKPAGVTVNSKDQVSLANGVAYYFKEHGIKRKVRFLNRLDRDTTGCIVIAKSGLAQSLYQQQWMIIPLKSGIWLLWKAS